MYYKDIMDWVRDGWIQRAFAEACESLEPFNGWRCLKVMMTSQDIRLYYLTNYVYILLVNKDMLELSWGTLGKSPLVRVFTSDVNEPAIFRDLVIKTTADFVNQTLASSSENVDFVAKVHILNEESDHPNQGIRDLVMSFNKEKK